MARSIGFRQPGLPRPEADRFARRIGCFALREMEGDMARKLIAFLIVLSATAFCTSPIRAASRELVLYGTDTNLEVLSTSIIGSGSTRFISLTGRLTDTSKEQRPLAADSNPTVIFRICDSAAATPDETSGRDASILWSEAKASVAVGRDDVYGEGVFTVILGSEKPIPAKLFRQDLFAGNERWLEVKVNRAGGQNDTLSLGENARLKIDYTAYAVTAGTLNGVSASTGHTADNSGINADRLDGYHASQFAKLDSGGRLASSQIKSGKGSGLDADKLDGLDGSAYLTRSALETSLTAKADASHKHSFAEMTGTAALGQIPNAQNANTLAGLPVSHFVLAKDLPGVQAIARTETAVNSLAASTTTLQTEVNNLKKQVAALQALLAGITRSQDGKSLIFSGLNLQVVNGKGSNTAANGLGNLIVGYGPAQDANGSHCLVIRNGTNIFSYGAMMSNF